MLIDNDLVKAEHDYRGHRLAEMYPRKRRQGMEIITPRQRPQHRWFAIRRLEKVAAD